MPCGYDSPWPSTAGMVRGAGDRVFHFINERLLNCSEEVFKAVATDELMFAMAAWEKKIYTTGSEQWERRAKRELQLIETMIATVEKAKVPSISGMASDWRREKFEIMKGL